MKTVIINKDNVKELAPTGVYTVKSGEWVNVKVRGGVKCNLVHDEGSEGDQEHIGTVAQYHYGKGDQYHYATGDQYHSGEGNQNHSGTGYQHHIGTGYQYHIGEGVSITGEWNEKYNS